MGITKLKCFEMFKYILKEENCKPAALPGLSFGMASFHWLLAVRSHDLDQPMIV